MDFIKSILWPDGKTKLFTAGDQRWNVAWLPKTREAWYLYADGYKKAADRLFESWRKNSFKPDYLIFPLVFLCRHYVELRLKELLQASSRLLQLPENWQCNHRVDNLWKTLRPLIRRICPDEPENDLDHVQVLILEFAQQDPISMEFRYPQNREGEAHLRDLECLDVESFYCGIQQLSAFLDSVSDGISNYLSDYQNIL